MVVVQLLHHRGQLVGVVPRVQVRAADPGAAHAQHHLAGTGLGLREVDDGQAGTGEKRVNSAMRDGAGTAFLTGLALVGVLSAGDQEPDNTKAGVKLVVALVVLVLVMANLRKPSIPQGLWIGLLGLSVLNVALAVFWSPAHAWA